MIKFTDSKLFVKGTCQAQLMDPCTMDVVFSSNAFQTGNITTSVNMGEIRGGMGNGIVAMLPQDSALNVEFTAADFSLAAKAAQLGATVAYGAPVDECQVVTASGTSISIDVADGAPVAPAGSASAICYVQEVGVAGTVAATGKAYPITAAGAVQGFIATSGKQYKVHYFVTNPTAQIASISSLFDPAVRYFKAQMPVFSKEGCSGENEGTRVGWLYITVPRLKLGGNGGVVGDATNADTTSISGQALSYDESVVSAACSDCEASQYAYYVYVPDNGAAVIMGLAVIGGLVEVPASGTAQIPVRFVMENGQLVAPASYATGFTYTASGQPTGTTVSNAGVVSAGATSGDFEVAVSYNNDGETLTCPVNVSVVS